MHWTFAAKQRRRICKLVPDSDMLTGLDAHGHLSAILKCILHALSYLRISDSLSPGYLEHFQKVGLLYAECDFNVTDMFDTIFIDVRKNVM